MPSPIIILPGIGNSSPSHWQSLWQQDRPGSIRLAPSSWDEPQLSDWLAAIEHAIETAGEPPVLVAHSLSCLLVAHWARVSSSKVLGAFLVAVPDPRSSVFPKAAATFTDVPQQRLPFPALAIASADDPFGSEDYARTCARNWGAGLVVAGALGHIGETSGVGAWKQGRDLLTAFLAGTGTAAD